MAANIPRVVGKKNLQAFCDSVKELMDTLTGKKKNVIYDRALTVKDLERLSINGKVIDLDRFLNCDKQNPYPL